MLRISFHIACLFVLLSCSTQDNSTTIPDYVLDKEQFSDLICDLSLAEAATINNVKNVRLDKFDSVYRFNPLLEHNISKKTFDTSIYFYSRHPVLFKEVFDLSLEKLSRMKADAENSKLK